MEKIKKLYEKIKHLLKHEKVIVINQQNFQFDNNGKYVNPNGRVYCREAFNIKNISGEMSHPDTDFSKITEVYADLETNITNDLAENIDNELLNHKMNLDDIKASKELIYNANAYMAPRYLKHENISGVDMHDMISYDLLPQQK